MQYIQNDIRKIINQIMQEQNVGISEIAKVLNMSEFKLRQKLGDKLEYRNKFTLLQLEKIVNYLGYDLHIDIINIDNNKDIRHCINIKDCLEKDMENICMFSDTDNIYD